MNHNAPINNRYDFMMLFDVTNGNPNGDPDAGNMPRIDPETGLGLVTDVCLKRKIRNYVEAVKEGEPGYRIYIKQGIPLNRSDEEALQRFREKYPEALDSDGKLTKKKDGSIDKPEADKFLRSYMCGQFFDIRTFGAVMTTMTKNGFNCGQVRGPVQLSFARSVDPITPQEITITRVAITTEADAEKKNTEMGNKFIVPYGLYKCEGFISAGLAEHVTGFGEEDLELLWQSLENMFDFDHSAARGQMALRKLIIFKHDSKYGSVPSHKLFDLVEVKKKDDVVVPRAFTDYDVTVNLDKLPDSVHCEIRE